MPDWIRDFTAWAVYAPLFAVVAVVLISIGAPWVAMIAHVTMRGDDIDRVYACAVAVAVVGAVLTVIGLVEVMG